jgi:hypothetical protein
MSGMDLQSLPQEILQLLKERQLALEKTGVIKSLEELYQALMSERLKELGVKITKDYPKLD